MLNGNWESLRTLVSKRIEVVTAFEAITENKDIIHYYIDKILNNRSNYSITQRSFTSLRLVVKE
jgi:hypothetical protein